MAGERAQRRPRPNHLSGEKSPYLQEHATNPVDWWPWGEAAFRKAKAEDKPVFLSIGYSSCHWCHVMREESFEDPKVARLMNETFVNIKVDREERPDVDMVYMSVCQMMTGSGGWPLTILMTPDKKPFLAATYVPKDNAFGRMGMLQLVPRVRQLWAKERQELLAYGDQMVETLLSSASGSVPGDPTPESLKLAFGELSERFDREEGGFGDAPKFPLPHNHLFLLRYWKDTGDARALRMVVKSLEAMRLGGIFDQLGGGFHRYSTDRRWVVPHFEKMLYDQAMLVMAYSEAFQATGSREFAEVVDRTVGYMSRRLREEGGGFCSSEDADSEGHEGTFYLWGPEELRRCLGADADLFSRVFCITGDEGGAVAGGPESAGGMVLHLRRSEEEWAAELGVPKEEFIGRLEAAKSKLYAARELRERPKRDEKILADWNGLAVAALAKASRALGRKDFEREAEEVASFLMKEMTDSEGRLVHTWRGEKPVAATLDDYAFVIWGLLELYQCDFRTEHLGRAISMGKEMAARFSDGTSGGFYFTAEDADAPLARQKAYYDGAVPSGNSVAAYVLLRLGRVSGDGVMDRSGYDAIRAAWGDVISAPSGHTMLLCALDYRLGPSHEVVVAGRKGGSDTLRMLRALDEAYLPNVVVLLRDADDTSLMAAAPFLASMEARMGEATAYVCEDLACQQPTTEIGKMMSMLESRGSVTAKE
ncbi:MAG TPA: thioredoxin domain-containing protein [Conexivisphaerales archaeon]|nr:thioredoxin domain-containing protein [Conexivisphaerales archaeon]